MYITVKYAVNAIKRGDVWRRPILKLRLYLYIDASIFTTKRRYALARYLLSTGVCPSACSSRSCIISKRLKMSKFFLCLVGPSLLFLEAIRCYSIPRDPSAVALHTLGWHNSRFLTEIADYLGKGTRQAHGCRETLMGSHRSLMDPCLFR